ncbi:glycosyltransferase family 4 protein [Mucilaginibacter xinganensis]|uniref:Glycosyltransferase involved in cell wall bisynthesis n=1 Tax=Mucilaginibacter xinganensis TaxID=1234841 RepID=A0A223NY17_9SPHI|nr:glycosyltransferase family 4 protein [Mucilaginibacter xinganensis]ASU34755.1 Glycosyltransferase involved in cell wall bisynthesis [Mucilaginibacter xinganensis]
MIKTGQKILIVGDTAQALMDFKGKLIEELAEQHKVYVFTPPILKKQYRDKLTLMKVGIYESQLRGSNVSIISDLKYIVNLYNVIKQVRPDIFFPSTFKPVIYGTLLAKLCRVKRIVPMLSGLGYNFTEKGKNGLLSKITRILLKFSLLHSRSLKIIFQNKDDYQTLLSYNILNEKHKAFVVSGSGVDLDHYKYDEPDTKNIGFLMMARLINAKGIYEYFEAAKEIRSRFPNIEFKLIGPYDNNVDAISAELFKEINSGTIVQYVGNVDDVRPYVKNAAIVVLPSYYGEGIPRSLLESMAMGRPIITCDSVGCRETIVSSPAINGFLVPPKDVPALVSKMEYYINNPHAIRTDGLNGLAYAKKRFSVYLVNADVLKIMELK